MTWWTWTLYSIWDRVITIWWIFKVLMTFNTWPRSEASSIQWLTCPGRLCCTHRDLQVQLLQGLQLDLQQPWHSQPPLLSLLSLRVSLSYGTTAESRRGKGGKCFRLQRLGWLCTWGRRTKKSLPLFTSSHRQCQALLGQLRPNTMFLPLQSGEINSHTFNFLLVWMALGHTKYSLWWSPKSLALHLDLVR